MARTRSRVKEEPVDEANDTMISEGSSTTTNRNQHEILASVSAMPSSGSTVRNDDVRMANGYANGHSVDEANSVPTFGAAPRQLIKAIQKLETLGIDSTLPSLPKIVVVGDQSHGKSSIIEAVCDISLPRSEGTCTRCVFQITTTACKPHEAWVCKISLQRKYARNLNSSSNRSLRWDDTGSANAVEFTTVREKTQLEHYLRLAQVAILNPSMAPQVVLEANNPEMENEISFSPNIISLEIASPELPELSLFDLPGAIAVAENASEQHLVNFIEKLITGYMIQTKALVLLTISADQDTETSTAFKYVNKSKAVDRCMGVITKPDLMRNSDKNERKIRRILEGKGFELGNGWFVTKQLSQGEVDQGVLHEEARERESNFFNDQEPWNDSLSGFSTRFGISNLQTALSKQLVERILEDLPDIYSRVETRLNRITRQLSEYPERVSEPCSTVRTESGEVAESIIRHLRGDGVNKEFRATYRGILRGLREQFKLARPMLNMTTPGFEPPALSVDDSDDSPEPTPTPSKARKGNDGHAITTPIRGNEARTPRTTVKTEERMAPAVPVKAVFRLDRVKQAYEDGSSSELEDQTNPQVTDKLTLHCIKVCRGLVEKVLDDVEAHITRMLFSKIEETLSTRRQTQFFVATRQIVNDFFLELLAAQRGSIKKILSYEAYKPIAYSGIVKGKEQEKQELHRLRSVQRVNEHFDILDARSGKTTKMEERRKKVNDDWIRDNLGTDQYAIVVDNMAGPISYYDVASGRILDTVAIHLEGGLLHALEKGLREKLFVGLHATDTDYCDRLLAEDPEREPLRHGLIAEKNKLMLALKELRELPQLT